MMTKKKQFGWVLVMALTTACSSTPKQAMQKEVSTIDLTEIEYSSTPQPLSDFVESIEYIKLSHTDRNENKREPSRRSSPPGVADPWN